MKKQLVIFSLCLSMLILVGVLVSAITYSPNDFVNIQLDKQRGFVQDEEIVRINIKQGWNLLPISFLASASGQNHRENACNQDIFYNVWIYSALDKKYYNIPTNENEDYELRNWISPKNQNDEFLLNEFNSKSYSVFAGSAWIYSEENCVLESQSGTELILGHGEINTINNRDFVLKAGWNLIPIDKYMVFSEAPVSEFFNGCGVEDYVFWDNENQEWISNKNEFNFNVFPDDIFKTFAVKTKTDCNFAKNILDLMDKNFQGVDR